MEIHQVHYSSCRHWSVPTDHVKTRPKWQAKYRSLHTLLSPVHEWPQFEKVYKIRVGTLSKSEQQVFCLLLCR